MTTTIRLCALVAVSAVISACNPVFHASQAELDEVRALVGNAQGSDEAASAAAAAQSAAEQARESAEAALEAVSALQGELEATNVRIDRMFEESQAK